MRSASKAAMLAMTGVVAPIAVAFCLLFLSTIGEMGAPGPVGPQRPSAKDVEPGFRAVWASPRLHVEAVEETDPPPFTGAGHWWYRMVVPRGDVRALKEAVARKDGPKARRS